MARVAIIGPGAIGGTLAGNLIRAGHHEIALGGRRPATHVDMTFPDGTQVRTGSVVTDPGALAGIWDWILVATKTYAAADTSRWLRALAGTSTRVGIFQNGVEHRERFGGVVAADQLVPVVIDCPAERPSPDQVVQRDALTIVAPDDHGGRALRQLFAGADEDFSLTDDFLSAAWRKLTRNSIGVLNALTLQPNHVLHDEAMGQAALGIARECVAVGRAAGAELDDALPTEVLAAHRAAPRDGVNSMLADRLTRRPTELDARNGVIVRRGREMGMPTPLNAMAIAVVEAQIAAETG